MSKVLIVEDDAHIRRLLQATLARAGHAVVEAETARAALSLAAIERPDVVLLDLGLPDRDGLEVIQLLKAQGGATLIVVSARDETADKVAALDLGADDYLNKPFDTEELLARIRAALRHRVAARTDSGVVTFGDVTVDLEHRRVLRAGGEVHLAPKEFGVLEVLAGRPDRVITHAALLRAVWGEAHVGDVEYLRVAVRAIRQRLETDPAKPRHVMNEPGVGYRLRLTPAD